jgi:hypothetical protein
VAIDEKVARVGGVLQRGEEVRHHERCDVGGDAPRVEGSFRARGEASAA